MKKEIEQSELVVMLYNLVETVKQSSGNIIERINRNEYIITKNGHTIKIRLEVSTQLQVSLILAFDGMSWYEGSMHTDNDLRYAWTEIQAVCSSNGSLESIAKKSEARYFFDTIAGESE